MSLHRCEDYPACGHEQGHCEPSTEPVSKRCGCWADEVCDLCDHEPHEADEPDECRACKGGGVEPDSDRGLCYTCRVDADGQHTCQECGATVDDVFADRGVCWPCFESNPDEPAGCDLPAGHNLNGCGCRKTS